jgi:hypothetical protein
MLTPAQFWTVLAAQALGWLLVYFLVGAFDGWRYRRAQARGYTGHVGHVNEIVLVAAVISLLTWIAIYVSPLVRELPGT